MVDIAAPASEVEAAPAPKKRRSFGGWALIAVPYAWLLFFFLAPFFIVFKISLSEIAVAIPPYLLPGPEFAALILLAVMVLLLRAVVESATRRLVHWQPED